MESQTKKKNSYFSKITLNKINKSPTQLAKILDKVSKKSSNDNNINKKLRNGLIDHPLTYLTVQSPYDFIVAKNSSARLKLRQSDFKTLVADELSVDAVKYALAMIMPSKIEAQFQVCIGFNEFQSVKESHFQTEKLFLVNTLDEPTLIIVDFKHKIMSFVNPKQLNSPDAEIYHSQFNKVCAQFNEKEVNLKCLDHPLQNDSGLSIINFVEQYLKYGAMNISCVTSDYRLELQHRVLRSSTDMRKTCIVCGTLDFGDWVQCDFYKRWTHTTCIGKNADDVKDDTIHYFCIICEANTPKEELKTLMENGEDSSSQSTDILETIAEESSFDSSLTADAGHQGS